ncbi:MAG TPA: octaprenyl diphosphate synthase, partial [Gammaproteobacteria bacterium]|nr:octaprenyl diphosphate synthase [Gammaproteobacteria bacterium]
NDADTTEERYFQVIERKTAKLFEAACQLGAVTSDASAEDEAALAKYGLHLGNAFQIVDDVLDYAASEEKLGKELGDDLAEGKPTLPLIYAMQVGDDAQTQLIRDAIEAGDRNSIDAVMEVVKATGAIDYSMQRAAKEADYALEQLHQLPNSGYKDAMEFVVNLAVQREY